MLCLKRAERVHSRVLVSASLPLADQCHRHEAPYEIHAKEIIAQCSLSARPPSRPVLHP